SQIRNHLALAREDPDLALVVDEEIVMDPLAQGPNDPGGSVQSDETDLVEDRENAAVGRESSAPEEMSVYPIRSLEHEPGEGLSRVGRPGLHDRSVHVHERRDGSVRRDEKV